MTITVDTVFERASDIVFAPIGDDGVMLNIDSGRYHGVNEVGARIWDLLAMPMSIAQLRDVLLGEFEIDAPTCEAAVIDFTRQLMDRGLVHAVA